MKTGRMTSHLKGLLRLALCLILFLLLVSSSFSAPLLEFEEERRELHRGQSRALLVPHLLPFPSSPSTPASAKDEFLVLGAAAAIIRLKKFDDLSILDLSAHHNLSSSHGESIYAVLNRFAQSLDGVGNSKTFVRKAAVRTSVSWQKWPDDSFLSLAAHFDALYFIGTEGLDGYPSCAFTHHRLRLIYLAAKVATTSVVGAVFNRRRLEARCPPTLRFLRAKMENSTASSEGNNLSPPLTPPFLASVALLDRTSLKELSSVSKRPPSTRLKLAADLSLLSPPPPLPLLSVLGEEASPQGGSSNGKMILPLDKLLQRLVLDRQAGKEVLLVHLPSSGRRVWSYMLSDMVYAVCEGMAEGQGLSLVYLPDLPSYSSSKATVEITQSIHIFQDTLRLVYFRFCLCIHLLLPSSLAISESCPALASSLYAVAEPLGAQATARLLAAADLVLSARTFFAAAAFTVGTPCHLVATAPARCNYLAQLFDLPSLCLVPEASTQPSRLVAFVQHAWRDKKKSRNSLVANKEKVEQAAMKNVIID